MKSALETNFSCMSLNLTTKFKGIFQGAAFNYDLHK